MTIPVLSEISEANDTCRDKDQFPPSSPLSESNSSSILNETPSVADFVTPDLSELDESENFSNEISTLIITQGAHEVSTSSLLNAEIIPIHLSQISCFIYFCYILSVFMYACMCSPATPTESSHDSYLKDNRTSNINDASKLDKSDIADPSKLLKSIKISNVNRLIIGQLNINSLRNKIEALKSIITGNIDILIITESKLDETFPSPQFWIDGYSPPFRVDRNKNGGGVIIYVREDVPGKELVEHPKPTNFEGIFFEINLKNRKWLVFGGYNPHKQTIKIFVNQLGPILDFYMHKYENFLLLGDFNSEMDEDAMMEFCEIYNLTNLIKEPTCFKNPLNPSSIDVILTNKPRCFQNSTTIETGLSDHHKLTITIMRSFYPKQSPVIKSYRDYRNFDEFTFRNALLKELYNVHRGEVNLETFQMIVVRLLNLYAPIKRRFTRANNSPFMNKTLSKAVMTRSRLRNRYIKNPTAENKANYTKYRNYCTGLFRKEKRTYYSNLDLKLITDNKKFWNTIGPLFSDKHFSKKKITLVEGEEIITDDQIIAETFNSYFANIVESLDIQGFVTYDYSYQPELDYITNIINKFKNHPSIMKIKENIVITERFNFEPVDESVIYDKIDSLDKRKPTTYNNIPARILVENKDIISPFITKIYNDSNRDSKFPNSLKSAEVTPVHKKEERINKDNYRPVSILPSISKIFERNIFDQVDSYIDKHLSPFLCGFRKGYSTQYCLNVMIDKWKKAIDSGKFAGALLTDLSKAFDCLNHELLIAKLEAYGFDKSSLNYIYSYLSNRIQRTKVNSSFSEWSDIRSGVPQGSILGPLLFNIYINDIFLFINKCDIANYADDNTPYTVEETIDSLLNTLEKDTMTLIKWFRDNYLKLNADKCHLLVSNHNKDVSINVDEEIIECESSVKLLGITLDNKLNFNKHVSNLCKKASQKIHALARISNYMCQDKLRVLMKAFIESQFGYCPLTWMFHSRTLNNRINRLHERALRLVYKNSKMTFDELLRTDNSFSIHHRNLQKLAIEIYKVTNNLSPPIMKNIFPAREICYDLRKLNPFKSRNVNTVYNGTETISFRGPKTWALVPEEIKKAKSLTEFKTKIKKWEPIGCTCRLCKVFIKDLGFI